MTLIVPLLCQMKTFLRRFVSNVLLSSTRSRPGSQVKISDHTERTISPVC